MEVHSSQGSGSAIGGVISVYVGRMSVSVREARSLSNARPFSDAPEQLALETSCGVFQSAKPRNDPTHMRFLMNRFPEFAGNLHRSQIGTKIVS